METLTMLASCFQKTKGSRHIGAHERRRIRNGIIVMRFSSKMDDGIHIRNELVKQTLIAYVTMNEA